MMKSRHHFCFLRCIIAPLRETFFCFFALLLLGCALGKECLVRNSRQPLLAGIKRRDVLYLIL